MAHHLLTVLFDTVADSHHNQCGTPAHLFTVDHDMRPDQTPAGLFKITQDIGVLRFNDNPIAFGRDSQKLLLVNPDGKVVFEIQIVNINFSFLIETHADGELAVGQKRLDVSQSHR